MPACSRCLVEVPLGTALCPKCGAAIRRPVMPRPTPIRPGKSRQRLNALNNRDRVIGPSTFVLLVSFWLPWYKVGPFSASGLSAHGWLFIAVVNSIVLVLYVVVTAFGVGDLRGTGPYVKGTAPHGPYRTQFGPRRLGVPLQAFRLQLVVGRISRADRSDRGFCPLCHSPHPNPTQALKRCPAKGVVTAKRRTSGVKERGSKRLAFRTLPVPFDPARQALRIPPVSGESESARAGGTSSGP